jgi:hypothetical protein
MGSQYRQRWTPIQHLFLGLLDANIPRPLCAQHLATAYKSPSTHFIQHAMEQYKASKGKLAREAVGIPRLAKHLQEWNARMGYVVRSTYSTSHIPHVMLTFTSSPWSTSSRLITSINFTVFSQIHTHLPLLHLSIIKQQKWLPVQPILTVTLLTTKLLASLPTRVTQLIVSCRPVRDSKLTTMLFLSPLHDQFSLYGPSY